MAKLNTPPAIIAGIGDGAPGETAPMRLPVRSPALSLHLLLTLEGDLRLRCPWTPAKAPMPVFSGVQGVKALKPLTP